MRRLLICLVMTLSLSGCLSLDSMYDEQARNECEQERARDRGACNDRVDQNRRDRDN